MERPRLRVGPPEAIENHKRKNPAAVELGRLGGLKGGPARAKKLTKAERVAIARKGGQAFAEACRRRGREAGPEMPITRDGETDRQRPPTTWRSRTWPARPSVDIPLEMYPSLSGMSFEPPGTS